MRKKHIIYCILAAGFTLGIFRGQLALWKDGAGTPQTVYPIAAGTLPAADQQLLQHGIRAETPEEVTALLEDYLS